MHTPASDRSQLINFPYQVPLAAFPSLIFVRLLQGACVLAPGSGEVFIPEVFDEPTWVDHLYSFREMPLLVPSLVLSIFAVCVAGAKAVIRTWRHWHKQILTWRYWHKQILTWQYWHKQISKIDIALTLILLVINILLLVFSIQQKKEIIRQILLSLANGALILYQWMCAPMFPASEKFCDKHGDLVIIHTVVIVVVSVLSPMLPCVLKAAGKGLHLAGLIFFAVEYCMLFGFYRYGCRSLYETPIHQRQGEDGTLIPDILRSNKILSVIAFAAAIPSAISYGKGVIDFELTLWIKYTAAKIWLLWWVLLKYLRKFNIKKAFWFWRRLQCSATNANSDIPNFTTHESPKESVEFQFLATDGDSKTGSFATDETLYMEPEVILPPPVHLSSSTIYKGGNSPRETAGKGLPWRDAGDRHHGSRSPGPAGNDTDGGGRHLCPCRCTDSDDDYGNAPVLVAIICVV